MREILSKIHELTGIEGINPWHGVRIEHPGAIWHMICALYSMNRDMRLLLVWQASAWRSFDAVIIKRKRFR